MTVCMSVFAWMRSVCEREMVGIWFGYDYFCNCEFM